jgi:DNA-binding transcriptional regulator/RsmH inhibitor MraZ
MKVCALFQASFSQVYNKAKKSPSYKNGIPKVVTCILKNASTQKADSQAQVFAHLYAKLTTHTKYSNNIPR